MASKVEEVSNGGLDNHVPGVEDLLSSLPRDDNQAPPLFLYGGFWLLEEWLPGSLAAWQHMAALDDDFLIASFPKSGMTWLKALVFAIVRRDNYRPGDPLHPLYHKNQHDYVEYLEELFSRNRAADLEALPSPRILSTHTPYQILSESIIQLSGCRVVFVYRDHKDNLVSH